MFLRMVRPTCLTRRDIGYQIGWLVNVDRPPVRVGCRSSGGAVRIVPLREKGPMLPSEAPIIRVEAVWSSVRRSAITLACPQRVFALALTTLQSINAEIKQLEAQKRLVEKRDGEVPKAIAVLQKYAKLLSAAQRRRIAKLIGEAIDVKPARAPKPLLGP